MKTIALTIGVAAMLLLANGCQTGPTTQPVTANAGGTSESGLGGSISQPVYTVSKAPAAYPDYPAKLWDPGWF